MTTRDESDTPATGAVSRREFFTGAGMTAGALAALGGIVGTTASPAAQAAAARDRKFFSSFVNFELDGAFAGRLLSAEGGEPVIVPGAESADLRTRTAPTLRFEPLTLRFGDMSAAVFDWVGKGSINAAAGRNAAVTAYDGVGKEQYRLAMQNARLTEIMFDGFDGGVAEAARVSAKLLPAQSVHDLSAKTSYKGETFRPTPLLRSNFRLYIQGVDAAPLKVRTIDPIGLQARSDGLLVPTALRFTLPLAFAGPVFTWMNDTLAGRTGARQGELQMMSRDFTKVAASIAFEQLSILRISCPIDATGTKSAQDVEVECLPMATKFNMGDLLVK